MSFHKYGQISNLTIAFAPDTKAIYVYWYEVINTINLFKQSKCTIGLS